MELEAQADAQTVQDIELEQDPVAVQERWNFYKKKAAIYYLANPAGDPWTNDTGAWAPTEETSNTLGTIDIENAKWEDGYVGNTVYKEKNIKENVSNHITSWPDGSTGTTWTVKSGNTTTGSYFTFILDSIWENYKKAISEDTGININNLDKSDILEITLTPRKISRDNGGKYPYHIDCALSIKSRSAFTAKFWVKNPNDTEYTQVDAKNYKTGDSVIKTEQGENEKVIDGITYVLDGWYPENDGGGACGDQKITTWPHRPTDPELADGTVNFYAHYIPLYTTVNIKKIVTGNMGDKSKAFHFKVSVVNGNINLPFNIGATQYSGSADITLSDNQTTMVTKVPVGATVTITENDYSGSRYTTSYTIGGSDSTIGNTAEISNIQQLNEDENTAHEVTFTNNKDAIPDTAGSQYNTIHSGVRYRSCRSRCVVIQAQEALELKAVVMKKKRSGKKGSCNAGAERFPQTEALNHEHEKLKEWFRTVRFRKVLFGGVDEVHLWKKLEELNQIYEISLSAERARYDALIADHQKSCDAMIRKYKELAERGTTGQDTNV